MDTPTTSAPFLPVPVGEVLDGKYRIERVVGAGAMGVVVAATHLELERRVAVKFLLPDVLERGEAVARFLREAQAVSRLESEHVARVVDSGDTPDGLPYMVIEYLSGEDLSQALAERGPLGVREAVDHVLEALDAIAEAHARGVVHRDLKPGNLYLARSGEHTTLKVLDFGVSKIFGEEGMTGASLTKTHTLVGSPLYMAPEQVLAAKQVDGRADIWALGVVLYELLVGEPPFSGETIGVLLTAVLSAPLPSLRARRPDVPEGLERVVERCLERDVSQRYQSAAELARALAPFASPAAAELLPRIEAWGQRGLRTPLPAPVAELRAPLLPTTANDATLPGDPPSTRPRRAPEAPAPPSRRGLWVALVIVIALVAGAFAARHFAEGSGPSHPVGRAAGEGPSLSG